MLKHITLRAAAVAIGALTLTYTLAGQAQPSWFGTWELNPAKSLDNPGPSFRRVTCKIEKWEDGVRVTYNMVGTRGGITHMEWTGKFDGRDYSVQGVDYVLTNAYRTLSDRSYEIIVRVDGSQAAVATASISADGRTLTVNTVERDARGRASKTSAVYLKR